MKLTTASIRTLALPPDVNDKIFFDSELRGFGLRIRASGVKTWLVQYAVARRTRRIALGAPAVLDANKAREAAKDILARVRLGEDPAGEKAESKAKARETFGECLKIYLARRRDSLRPRSYVEIERHLAKNLKTLHSMPIEEVTRRTIAIEIAKLAEVSGPVQANRTATSVHGFMRWCVREGLLETNPAADLNKNPESPRARVLSLNELSKIWRGLPAGDFADVIRLLILTGQRETEVGDLRWSEVNLDRGTVTLPASRTKNHRMHTFPLSAPAAAILEARPRPEGRDLVFGTDRRARGFGAWGYLKERLDATVQFDEPWTIHDLRRSFSTGLGDLGIPPHTIEVLINHQSGTKAGVSGRYNKSAYEREGRQAVELWADTVLAAVEGRESNVTQFKRA
jgi:integrase